VADWDFRQHGPPIPVPDGIKARSQRGGIGRTWWSRRFLAALDEYYTTTPSRLARGRSYARAGQVVTMTMEPGLVEAVVQGSRHQPYAVAVRVRTLKDAEWQLVEAAMAARAVFLARLLAGEMPVEIQDAFASVHLSLFPVRRHDLETECTCPDTANPCKHVAAAFYLLAESFDVDPFRMFEWRGRPRARLVSELRAKRRPASAPAAPAAGIGKGRGGGAAAGGTDVEDDIERFWRGRPGFAEIRIEARPTSPPDALLRQMDADVLRVLGADAPATLRPLYVAAARAARARLDPGRGAGGTCRSHGRRRRG